MPISNRDNQISQQRLHFKLTTTTIGWQLLMNPEADIVKLKITAGQMI